MRGIKKSFPGVNANDNIDFQLKAGEVHALLGENGAGKTTLMNILYGLYKQDEGEIFIKGQKVDIKNPKHAIQLGIGMVHQHFMLVDVFSVMENVVLGLKQLKVLIPTKKISKKLDDYSKIYGLKIDPNAKIWQLSTGEKQKVEIIKTLYRGADILILDEPTSVLAEAEIKPFFEMLRKMVDEGKSIIFITHKLSEVLSISDRVTVLRKGKNQDTLITSETNKRQLARLMVGRDVIFRLNKTPIKKGNLILDVKNLHAINDKGIQALKGVSFKIYGGEILGVVGVAGNGQKELLETITGLRNVTSGEIYIKKENVTNKSPRVIIRNNVAHIPEDRIEMGIVPNMNVSENLILKKYNQVPLVKDYYEGKIKLILNNEKIQDFSQKLVNDYDILTPNIETPVKLLSGGNIQRLILARELSSQPSLIVASHPTYGLDVSATEFIHTTLLKERERGVAILLVTEDLNEILSLSDRIAVIYEGEFVNILDANDAKLEEIGLMMVGERNISSNGGPKYEN
jgi:simple sugar transport system ATP-binding protein